MKRILPDRDLNEVDQLMEWIKTTSMSSPRNTQLQNLGNGVVFCRIMAKIFPGSLASVLIINRAANESDSMFNYMLLQAAFGKAKIPWSFDTEKLIACNTSEQLKLTKTLSHYSDAFKNQLQLHQSKKSSPRANTCHSSRCPAGELDIDIDIEEQACGSIDPLDALDAFEQSLASFHDEQTQSTADHVEPQLNQQIQALFLSQQAAMTSLSAGQQPLATPTHHVLCLCSKCLKNLPNNSSTNSNTSN